MDSSMVKINIHSDILIEKSQWFREVFDNYEGKLKGKGFTMNIKALEESAFIQIMEFIYGSPFSTSDSTKLLDVLKIADKFGVASCIRSCSYLLAELDMSVGSALSYLDISSRVVMVDAIQQLADVAQKFLATTYKNISRHKTELLNLPISGIQAVLSSDDLEMHAEDDVFEFLAEWSEKQIPNHKQRREAMSSDLGNLIRFPHLSPCWLKWAMECKRFNEDFIYNAVMEAWAIKSQRLCCRTLASEEPIPKKFVGQKYSQVPEAVHLLGPPTDSTVVYFSLSGKQCRDLSPSRPEYLSYLESLKSHMHRPFPRIFTQPFLFAGGSLSFECYRDFHPDSTHSDDPCTFFDSRTFALRIHAIGDQGAPANIVIDIAARSNRHDCMFEKVVTTKVRLESVGSISIISPFNQNFGEIFHEGSHIFVCDQLCLRVELAVVS